MACQGITLTNVDSVFIGPKEIYFYGIIYKIKTRKYIWKSRLQNVGHFITASMSQTEPFELHVIMWEHLNCHELFIGFFRPLGLAWLIRVKMLMFHTFNFIKSKIYP